MGRLRDVQDFARAASAATSIVELDALLGDTARALGCNHYTLAHHSVAKNDGLVRLGNYPEAWVETLYKNRYIHIDPILTACHSTAVGFRWSEVGQLITLSSTQREILALAAKAGLEEGFTVPIHLPGSISGSCSFALAPGRKFHQAMVPAMQYVACFGFEAARRLVKADCETREANLLTPRQLDCVMQVARGKSDWESAQLLGISAQTVHQHIEAAKRKFGVATRTQLVVKALFRNQLNFLDIIDR
jgi:LuxR family transcriptional regulator, quorum-sensing system regulator CciR